MDTISLILEILLAQQAAYTIGIVNYRILASCCVLGIS